MSNYEKMGERLLWEYRTLGISNIERFAKDLRFEKFDDTSHRKYKTN